MRVQLLQGKYEGFELKLDEADLDLIKVSWHFNRDRYLTRSTGYGKTKEHYMLHREVAKRVYGTLPEGCHVDHINGDIYDNQRCNLRVTTAAGNIANSQRSKANSSGFKGVSWHKQSQKWAAYICPNRKKIHLGLFDSALEAAKAYDRAAVQYFGEFAKTNAMLGLLQA